MSTALDKTLFFLTKKNNLKDISVDELLHLVNKHPYFAPAQLALAVKLKADNNILSKTQLQKAALYFHNQNWLQYQLLNGDLKNFAVNSSELHTVPIAPPSQLSQKEPVKATFTDTNDEYQAFVPGGSPKIKVPTVEEVRGIMQNMEAKKKEEPDIIIELPQKAPLQSATLATEDQNKSSSEAEFIGLHNSLGNPIIEKVNYTDTGNNSALSDEDQQTAKFSSVLANQLADFHKPVQENAKLDFEMEPFYTIDYFASQGIKADLTQLPHDRLTKQLLTFTDWLKKMKQVGPNPQDLGTDPELETIIQNIAQSSNEVKEIATETMAEVFVKQGKIDKAVQLYIKLSFLDPEKSTYFAGKIQQLKGM